MNKKNIKVRDGTKKIVLKSSPSYSNKQVSLLEKVNTILKNSIELNSSKFSDDEIKYLNRCILTHSTVISLTPPEVDKSIITDHVPDKISYSWSKILQVIAVITYTTVECILHNLKHY